MKRLELKNIIKESITDYLSELNTVTEEGKTEETPKETKEALGTSAPGTMFEDKVTKEQGSIFLVRKPTKDMTEGGIVNSVTLKSLVGDEYIGGHGGLLPVR